MSRYFSQCRRSRWHAGSPIAPNCGSTYSCDLLGRLVTVSTAESNDVVLSTPEVTTYSYDLVGNLQRIDQANGVITVYVYDDLNRLDKLTHYAPDETPENLSDKNKLAEYDYTVRADGRRTGVHDSLCRIWLPHHLAV